MNKDVVEVTGSSIIVYLNVNEILEIFIPLICKKKGNVEYFN